MKPLRPFLLAFCLFTMCLPPSAREARATGGEAVVIPAGSGRITVRVSGLRNSDGSLSVGLFNAKKGFPGKFDKALKTVTVPAAGAEPVAHFDQVPWGTYAVAVRHDENGNGKLDANFLGMPKEGVGTSNNPRTSFGPPSFEDASFVLEQAELEMTIRLKYL